MTIRELWYLETLTSEEVQRTVDTCILNKGNLPKDAEERAKLKVITKVGALFLARDFELQLDQIDQSFINKCTDHLENYVDAALHYSTPEFVESHVFPILDDLYYRSAKNGRGIQNYDEHKNGYIKSLRGVTKSSDSYPKPYQK